MNLLLDTNTLLWAMDDSRRLPEQVLVRLRNADNRVYFSTASIWETAIKSGRGRASFRIDAWRLAQDAGRSGIQELPVTSYLASRVAYLPHHHKDPFDRLIVAQAMELPARLLTADRMLQQYSELVEVFEALPQ